MDFAIRWFWNNIFIIGIIVIESILCAAWAPVKPLADGTFEYFFSWDFTYPDAAKPMTSVTMINIQ